MTNVDNTDNTLELKSAAWGAQHSFSGYGVSAVIANGPEEDSWRWDRGEGLLMLGVVTKNVRGVKKPFMRFESNAADKPIKIVEMVKFNNCFSRPRSVGGIIRYKNFFKKAVTVDNTYDIDGEIIHERQYWVPPKNTHALVGWKDSTEFSVRYESVDGYYHFQHDFNTVLGDLLQKNVGLPFDDEIVKKLAQFIGKNPFVRAWSVDNKGANSAIDLTKSYSRGIDICHWRMTYSYPRLIEVIGNIVAERYRNQLEAAIAG